MPSLRGVTREKKMINSLKRNLQCRQVGQVQLNLSVNGTAVAPVASGPDAHFVESITKNSTGNFTITFKEPSKIAPFVSGIVCVGGSYKTPSILASTVNSVTIAFENRLGAAADTDFNIQLQWADQLSYYF
jgi:hypothetical protein